MDNNEVKINLTSDVWFASYLKFNKYILVDFTVIARGKAKYAFQISNEDWKNEKFNFLNSDISKIKQIMEELKDLIY